MPASKPIPLEGVLNCWNGEYDLPDLLLRIAASGKTGRLQFSNAEGDKTVYVKEGKIIFAESSSDDDSLGQYLLRSGKISLRDYSRVSKLVEPGKRLGALLVAEGVLEPKDLVPAVVGQVRAIILGLFRRTETWYGFKEEELSRKESITLDMPVAQLILDGVQYVESWRRVAKGAGDLDSAYQLVESAEPEWSRLKLDPNVAGMLSMLKSATPLAELCTRANIADFDACRLAWAFRALGWIEPAELSPEVAAESSYRAEMTCENEPQPVAPPSLPAAPPPDLSSTVLDIADSKLSIPQHLVETQVTGAPPEEPAPAALVPPRPIPEDLVHTRLAIDAPADPATEHATTIPEIAPKPVPDELIHTRFYIDSSPELAPPAPPSTGEMLEALLDGGSDGEALDSPGAPAWAHLEPGPSEIDPDSSTQFFTQASALTPEAPPPVGPEPSYEDYFQGSPSFAALSLDYQSPSAVEAPITEPSVAPPEPEFEPSAFSAFQGSSISDQSSPFADSVAPESMPLIEAVVLENSHDDPAASGELLPPQLVKTQPSVSSGPAGPAGMEMFASNDPFGSSSFATDDPFQAAETPVGASLPNRPPRTEDLDLDMDGLGHFFGGDEER